ncbi:helix-turn-helix transcriptional regulator [Demequina sp.]|uniref:helix-turn-helix transcriptional regulator n=1 Tax=Demequina sp. TaxID=2050685 RepID=UPI003A87122A
MAENSRARMVRLLGMVAYLEAHGATPVTVLAEHFGVRPDRITADVWMLGTSGVPPYLPDEMLDFDFGALDDEGLVVLVDAQGLTQVRLSGQEAVALTGALATLIAAGTAPEGAQELLTRISEAFGGVAPVTVLDGADAVAPQVRSVLESAIADQVAVRLDYVDAQDRRTERVIEPHQLVTIDGIGYIECWCRRAQGYRTLRLGRIQAADALAEPHTHGPSAEHGFSLESRFDAVVRLDRSARWALEDIAGAHVEDDGDTAVVTLRVTDPDWTAARLLAIAPSLRSVEPAVLKEALARQANAVAQAQGA